MQHEADGEKITDDTWRAKQKIARKKRHGEIGKGIEGEDREKKIEKREQNGNRIYTRAVVQQSLSLSLSPDNRQLEERGGCRGG